jgi:hypothetical protein
MKRTGRGGSVFAKFINTDICVDKADLSHLHDLPAFLVFNVRAHCRDAPRTTI